MRGFIYLLIGVWDTAIIFQIDTLYHVLLSEILLTDWKEGDVQLAWRPISLNLGHQAGILDRVGGT